jgi:ABC-type Fe3+/spermidine/putrescine transport system ATPase subunit
LWVVAPRPKTCKTRDFRFRVGLVLSFERFNRRELLDRVGRVFLSIQANQTGDARRMASLQLLGVTKVFASGVQGVRATDWNQPTGELRVLFGPSGAGKTTLLRMIAGLEQPTSGRIVVDGIDVTRLPPRQRNIGLVFQQGSLYSHLNVEQNLQFALRPKGWSWSGLSKRQAQRVGEVAERVGIASWLKRMPAELSGGEQQRVALARALVRQPRLLLLDEPLASLDGPVRQTLARDLKEWLRERQLTAIHVTHDLREALALADRVAVMVGGELRQLDTPQRIVQAPADQQVAALVGQDGGSGWASWASE